VRKKHFHVLLTTYELLMSDADRARLTKVKWASIVVDEGHRWVGCMHKVGVPDSTIFRKVFRCREITTMSVDPGVVACMPSARCMPALVTVLYTTGLLAVSTSHVDAMHHFQRHQDTCVTLICAALRVCCCPAG
jgi:hypothetical protein